MQLRLIEIVLPPNSAAASSKLLHEDQMLGRWDDVLDDDSLLIRLLVDAAKTEELLDDLQNRFSSEEKFRVMLLPVEATLPRPKSDEPETVWINQKQRISREELYHDVAEGAAVTPVFLAQVVIATLVATVGLLRDDTAILVGAMVIAPLLGPNVSLCLGAVLGDWELIFRSLKTNAVGLALALLVSMSLILMLDIDPKGEAIQNRIQPSREDIILALAAGCAGVLAFTTGAPSSLIGVMVAVALLPPFAVFGLMLASGNFAEARGALLLVATNVICVNLAGVATFYLQGVRPRTWWESRRARRSTFAAMLIWSVLLLILSALLTFAPVKS